MLRQDRSAPRTSDRPASGRPYSRSHFRRHRLVLDPEPLESRRLLATFVVTNTLDNGSNAIAFEIPASTAPNLDSPVVGFDPVTQTWTITPVGALPVITTPVDIDGF